MTYLLDRKVTGPTKWYPTRRRPVLAIVVHVTAGLEDLDGAADHSAERTAAYCASTDRAVSWHSGSDSDSSLALLPASHTAWHCQGYNSVTYGHEISKTHPDWRTMPPEWTAATLGHAAGILGLRARELGVPVRHATRADLDDAIARDGPPVGFLGHAELDPARRRDPGLVARLDTFPWSTFLRLVATPAAPVPAAPAVPLEVDMQLAPTAVTDSLPCTYPACSGWWNVTADGGVRTEGPHTGDHFRGSYWTLDARHRNTPRVFFAIAPRVDGQVGYVIHANDGAYYTF